MSEFIGGFICVGLLASPVALWRWGAGLHARGAPRFVAWTPTFLWIALPMVVLGGALMGAIAHRRHALSVSNPDPALRSKILADAIAEGLNCAAFGFIGIVGVTFLALAVAQVMVWRRGSVRGA